jgi:glucose/arabinose dehydrogenase
VLRAGLGLLIAVVSLAASSAGVSATPTVTVRLVGGKASLSRKSVPAGVVRFVVTNAGRLPHDFAVGGKRTRPLKRGERQTLLVRFSKPGAYRYVIRTRGASGSRGTIRVVAPTVDEEPPTSAGLKLTRVGAFDFPTDIDAPPGDADRLVVVEQRGLIHLLVDGERREQPFLDLREHVGMNGEAGLLSIAFAPDYAESGRLYVYFNDRFGNLHLVEYRRAAQDPNRADPDSARELLYQTKFAANHNGGMLQFGSDGKLYLAVGDGGNAIGFSPGQFAQSLESIFGKILRFDVDVGSQDVWARGLRNPWRFWIDAKSSSIYIADVGQDQREEIDVVPLTATQPNFGWPCFEGTLRFDAEEKCAAVIAPVHEYPHARDACSITGGVVVRDPRLPPLDGAYLFGDLCGATLQSLRLDGARAIVEALPLEVTSPISFGVDALDRVYVGSAEGGVFRLDPG